MKEIDDDYFNIQVVEGKIFKTRYKAFKVIMERIKSYMSDKGIMDLSVAVNSPNLVKIASEADSYEIVKLLKMLIIIAVTCTKHETFIDRIQKLDVVLQTHLMHIIGPELGVEPEEQSQENREIALEEQLAKVLSERNELLDIQAHLESLVQELTGDRDRNKERIDQLESKCESYEQGTSQVVEELKKYIAELEMELDDAKSNIRDNEIDIRQMSDTIENNVKARKEVESLRKQVDENNQELERLYKVESVAKKYKARLQEQKDLERRIETLENQNFQLKHLKQPSSVDSNSKDGIKTIMADNILESEYDSSREVQQKMLSEELEENLEKNIPAETRVSATILNENIERNFSQPSSSDQVSIENLQNKIKDLQLELELVTSAWYSLGSRIQQQNVIVMKKAYESPKGWITKQRLAMDRIP